MATNKIKDLSDEALLLRFQNTQNNHCFKLLVSRYEVRLYNTAFKILGNPYEAEEIVQETFIRLFIGFNKYRTNIPFSAWLFTITNNLCKDLLRLKQRSMVYENIPYSPLSVHEHEDWGKEYRQTIRQIADRLPGPAQQLEAAEERDFVIQSLTQLPRSQKKVIILRDIEGLSYRQIAALTGTAIGTVRSRLFYGREKLKVKLKICSMQN